MKSKILLSIMALLLIFSFNFTSVDSQIKVDDINILENMYSLESDATVYNSVDEARESCEMKFNEAINELLTSDQSELYENLVYELKNHEIIKRYVHTEHDINETKGQPCDLCGGIIYLVSTDQGSEPVGQEFCIHYPLGVDVTVKTTYFDTYKCNNCSYKYVDKYSVEHVECNGYYWHNRHERLKNNFAYIIY